MLARSFASEISDSSKYLLNALYRAGTIIRAEAESGHAQFRPSAADEFHVLLVQEVLDALERESEADAQFVDGLRSAWEIARRS